MAIAAKQAEFHPEGVALVAVTSACAFLAPPQWNLGARLLIRLSPCGPLLASLGVNNGPFFLAPSTQNSLVLHEWRDFFCCSVVFLNSPILVLPPKNLVCTHSHIQKQLCSFMSSHEDFFFFVLIPTSIKSSVPRQAPASLLVLIHPRRPLVGGPFIPCFSSVL